MMVTTTECASDPFVPVTFTEKVPRSPENTTLSVELAEPFGRRATLDGLSITVRPGVTVFAKETVPVKPLILVRVIVDDDECVHPEGNNELGLAEMVKSGELTVEPTVICLVPEKLVPMTVPTTVYVPAGDVAVQVKVPIFIPGDKVTVVMTSRQPCCRFATVVPVAFWTMAVEMQDVGKVSVIVGPL